MKKSATIIFRLRPELKENIQQLATQQQRSVGGQIRVLLEKALSVSDAQPSELSR